MGNFGFLFDYLSTGDRLKGNDTTKLHQLCWNIVDYLNRSATTAGIVVLILFIIKKSGGPSKVLQLGFYFSIWPQLK